MDMTREPDVTAGEESLIILQSLLCVLREKNLLTRADLEELAHKVEMRAAGKSEDGLPCCVESAHAASNAMPAPVIPPPMTTMSSVWPSASAVNSLMRRDALSAAEFVTASGIRSMSGRVRRRARRRPGSVRRSVRTGWSTV